MMKLRDRSVIYGCLCGLLIVAAGLLLTTPIAVTLIRAEKVISVTMSCVKLDSDHVHRIVGRAASPVKVDGYVDLPDNETVLWCEGRLLCIHPEENVWRGYGTLYVDAGSVDTLIAGSTRICLHHGKVYRYPKALQILATVLVVVGLSIVSMQTAKCVDGYIRTERST